MEFSCSAGQKGSDMTKAKSTKGPGNKARQALSFQDRKTLELDFLTRARSTVAAGRRQATLYRILADEVLAPVINCITPDALLYVMDDKARRDIEGFVKDLRFCNENLEQLPGALDEMDDLIEELSEAASKVSAQQVASDRPSPDIVDSAVDTMGEMTEGYFQTYRLLETFRLNVDRYCRILPSVAHALLVTTRVAMEVEEAGKRIVELRTALDEAVAETVEIHGLPIGLNGFSARGRPPYDFEWRMKAFGQEMNAAVSADKRYDNGTG